MAYYDSMQSSTSDEPLDTPSSSYSRRREERTHPAYQKVYITGLPVSVDYSSNKSNRVNKFTLFSFADSLCSHYGHMRFPMVWIGKNEGGKKSATFSFETEKDAEQFCQFPHANPFPSCRLVLSRRDPDGELIDNFVVEEPEFNKNPPVSRVIVLFQNLPKNITEDDIINLIGEDFIRLNENENYCVKIFHGNRTVSAKVVMMTHYWAHHFVEEYNGKIFYPHNVAISVCLN